MFYHFSEEYEASREPYEDEKLLCTTLITYLQKFLLTDGESQNSSQDLSASGKFVCFFFAQKSFVSALD